MKKALLMVGTLMVGALCLVGCGSAMQTPKSPTTKKTASTSDTITVTCQDETVEINPEQIEEEADVVAIIGEGTEAEMAEDVVNAVIEREALYQIAEAAGVEISDTEFENYANSLISSVGESENQAGVQEYINSFGGFEGYFEKMGDSLKKNLTISKFFQTEGGSAEEFLGSLKISEDDKQKLIDMAKEYLDNINER